MDFRLAKTEDIDQMYELLVQAKEFLRQAGVDQWQGDYPNRGDIESDITAQAAYVVTIGKNIAGMVTVLFDDEPAYASIEGKWCSEQPYATIHRMAVNNVYKGKGISGFIIESIEALCRLNGVFSIKTDTDKQNKIMNHLLVKNGFSYCGVIQFQGSGKEAYEKILGKNS